MRAIVILLAKVIMKTLGRRKARSQRKFLAQLA
jgi:hypothetical protein